MEFLFSLPVLAAFMLILRVRVPARVVFLPFAVLLLGLLLVGLSLLIAPLAVLFSDVERVIRIALRLLFYASPVIYAVRHVPPELTWIYALNPFAGILDLIRFLVLPNQSVHGLLVLSSAVLTVAIFFLGVVGVLPARARRPEGAVGMSGMSHAAPALRVMLEAQGVGIRFHRNRRKRMQLRELLIKGHTGPGRRGEFWALRDVVHVRAGEAVGVVGANGSGKSTLLKLIAGVLLPDEGPVEPRRRRRSADRAHWRVRR